jgi:hypothetical protein
MSANIRLQQVRFAQHLLPVVVAKPGIVVDARLPVLLNLDGTLLGGGSIAVGDEHKHRLFFSHRAFSCIAGCARLILDRARATCPEYDGCKDQQGEPAAMLRASERWDLFTENDQLRYRAGCTDSR